MASFRSLPVLLLLSYTAESSLTVNRELPPLSQHLQSVDCHLVSSAISFEAKTLSLEPVSKNVGFLFLELPMNCWQDEESCDWATLGVGKQDPSGDHLCCSEEAIDLQLCGEQDRGSLFLQPSRFSGLHIIVDENTSTKVQTTKCGRVSSVEDDCYMMTYNCHEKRRLQVTGEFDWAYHDTLDDDDDNVVNLSPIDNNAEPKAGTNESVQQTPSGSSLSESSINYESRSQPRAPACCATLSNLLGLAAACISSGMMLLAYNRCYKNKKVIPNDALNYDTSELLLQGRNQHQLQLSIMTLKYVDDADPVPQETC